MIIVLKPHTTPDEVEFIAGKVAELGYEPKPIYGVENTVIAAVGDENNRPSLNILERFDAVEEVLPIQKKFKLASREYHPEDSVVMIGNEKVGGGHHAVVAGPCAVESYDQLRRVVADLTQAGIRIIRGGVYKPRTSPYDFQGLGEEGLEIFARIKKEFGIAVITEVVGVNHISDVAQVADCLQIGARNSQNYNLIEEVAKAKKPVLLKRGMSMTIDEWFLAAEYLLVNGCPGVVLCERGIRTYEHAARNTLDLTAVVIAKKETHLPVMVDPSHACGKLDLVMPLARAAVASGADGLLVESHPEPMKALSDAAQQIPSADFMKFMDKLRPVMQAMDWKEYC